MSIIPTDPIWIDQDADLAELCERWSQQAAIAVDTEFMRSDTFYPIAGLIQVGDGKGCYLIDPLAITDFEPFRQLMLNPAVTKVLHACSEDLEVFQRLLGVVPEPLFDTQIAAAFAGLGFSLGYAGLVKALLNIEIPKSETRSDWLQRPLAVAQLKYAALDVAHLLIVYGKLVQTLREKERLQWVADDCAELVRNARQEPDFLSYYLKVGSAWKLRRRELAILQQLCHWREVEARARDLPRNRLAKENALWEIARWQPTELAALQRVNDLPSRTLDRYGEQLLAIVKNGLEEDDESAWPERLPAPLGREHTSLLKALKRLVRERAQQLQVPPELLVRKREYEALVRSGFDSGDYHLPERLKGWRHPVVGEALLALASEHEATRPADTGTENAADSAPTEDL
ncbi:ribonuclease D [Marinimicrobium sp. ABcell2]|uniref:ribonuclease D n=1 Tax=Marinimicrobium sp. ABcell2 TaxID=3069751 RepID=UPI0027B1A0E8|nr:ribonuclease D [Marinimicrobium sp. ABcell2]MDQ2077949.1 ribonuclease D [Marinimicrobium sp. ABcell2]